jgi:hypothetical protein
MISKHFTKIETHILQRSKINMRHIFRMMEDDSLLIILSLLSVLNIVLAPLPVNSFILGVPLMFLSIAYIFKIDLMSKKYRWMRRPVKCVNMRRYLPHSKPIFTKLEKYISPRFSFFVKPQFRIFAGLTLFFLALVVFLPIPFANIPGSIGMLLISVGILQKDGLFVAIGYGVAVLHLIGIIVLASMVGYGISL